MQKHADAVGQSTRRDTEWRP